MWLWPRPGIALRWLSCEPRFGEAEFFFGDLDLLLGCSRYIYVEGGRKSADVKTDNIYESRHKVFTSNKFTDMNKTFRKVMGLDKKVSGMNLEKDFEFDPTAVARARKEGKRCFFDLIILDESGSMCTIYKQALDGVNETLNTIRQSQTEDDSQRHFVSLVAFDSSHLRFIYNGTPAEKTKDITTEQYRPGECTPLYDAMGVSIHDLRTRVADEDIVMVTVITDGEENSSQVYTSAMVKALVDELRLKGWTFTYLGANQDVEAVATDLNIDNYMAFEASEEGAQDMWKQECKMRKRYYSLMADLPEDELYCSKSKRVLDYFKGWKNK